MAKSVSKKAGAGKRAGAKRLAARKSAVKKGPAKKRIVKRGPAKKHARTKPKARKTPAPPAPEIRYVLGRLIDSEESLVEATAGLLALDPEIVARLIEIGGRPPLRRREPGFAGMAAIIVSQQVSVASANAIYRRLETALAPLEAKTLLEASYETLRGCGLSSPKIRALRALAKAIAEEGLDLTALATLDAADAHRALIAVKGVGPWTADIFLLFCIGHPDAFPHGDLALQEAARLALGLETRPDCRELARLAERWRPWRGVAARMLWAFYREAKQRSGMALANASG